MATSNQSTVRQHPFVNLTQYQLSVYLPCSNAMPLHKIQTPTMFINLNRVYIVNQFGILTITSPWVVLSHTKQFLLCYKFVYYLWRQHVLVNIVLLNYYYCAMILVFYWQYFFFYHCNCIDKSPWSIEKLHDLLI